MSLLSLFLKGEQKKSMLHSSPIFLQRIAEKVNDKIEFHPNLGIFFPGIEQI